MKRADVNIAIAIVSVLAITLPIIGIFATQFWMLEIRVGLAQEQVDVFYGCRDGALALDANTADKVGYLEYVIGYYPPGTKQQSGSLLNKVVEQVRKDVGRQIITDLKGTSGLDYGTDPNAWIQAAQRGMST